MRSTPELDAKLRARLKEAVQFLTAGNVEKFGKEIGYENGGYIRLSLRSVDPRPVRSSVIAKIHAHAKMAGWFDGVLTPMAAADVRAASPAAGPAWPFTRLTPEEWERLGDLRHVVEDVAVTKARELLAELASSAPGQKRKRAA